MLFICPNLSSEFLFQIFSAMQFWDTIECKNFSLRILLLTRIRRIQEKCLSVCGEYSELRVVYGTQNRLRIRGKNRSVHGEDAKRHNIVYVSVNKNTNINLFTFFLSTVGAQSIARLCQNLINCRRNIWAHKRRRKLRFFLFERS